jgi:hypothetical protein
MQALFYPKNPTLSDWSGDKIRAEASSEKSEPCHLVRTAALSLGERWYKISINLYAIG